MPHRLPGRTKLARAITNLVMSAGSVEIQTTGLIYRAPSLLEPIAFHLLTDGCYDRDTCAVIQRALRRAGTFLDVGANIGAMSLWAAQACCPDGRVLGFEASPAIFQYLSANAAVNRLANFTPLNYAVTQKEGDTIMFHDAPEAKFGMGSLACRFGGSGVAVPTMSLDTAVARHGLSSVDLIKVDVEGFELGVFQGAVGLLRQEPAPVVVFEFNDWAEKRPESGITPGAAQRFLLEQGFRLQPVKDYLAGKTPGTAVQTAGGSDLVATRPHA